MRTATVVLVLACTGLLSVRLAFADPGDELVGKWSGVVIAQPGRAAEEYPSGSSYKITLMIKRHGSDLVTSHQSDPDRPDCTPLQQVSGESTIWTEHCGRVTITYELGDKLYYDEEDYSAHHSYKLKGSLTRGTR
jgi:hypothetical protein